jgi:intracellular sulfur oxidation DsrE/DsrF family protein
MKSRLLLILLAGMVSATTAYADDYNRYKKEGSCPALFQSSVDTEFGDGTSADTTCITKRNNVLVVLNMSTNVLNPKSGISQTLNNALLMIENYSDVYGIEIGKDLKFNVVAHFQGGQFLLSDEAYNKLKSTPNLPYAGGNPSRSAVEKLLDEGVQLYMCQNTMRGNGWKTADLIPGVEQVPGGVVALADFAQRGWAVITP